jgi:hypothetical protein
LYHRTWEVGDGVGDGDGERSVDALAAHGYVLTEEALRDLERPEKEEATGREKARRSPLHLEVVWHPDRDVGLVVISLDLDAADDNEKEAPGLGRRCDGEDPRGGGKRRWRAGRSGGGRAAGARRET